MEIDKSSAELGRILANEGRVEAIRYLASQTEKELLRKGIQITEDLRAHAWSEAEGRVGRLCREIRRSQLSNKLNELLDAETKKKAKRIAEREVIITQSEFAKFIFGAETLGFSYRAKHHEFLPEVAQELDHRKFGDHDPETGKLTKAGKKAFNQVMEIFRTRRQLHVHWFENGPEWHCFYFDSRDLLSGHWQGGDHIHYLSFRWGLLGDSVWLNFDRRDYTPDSAHIRYRHDMRSK